MTDKWEYIIWSILGFIFGIYAIWCGLDMIKHKRDTIYYKSRYVILATGIWLIIVSIIILIRISIGFENG